MRGNGALKIVATAAAALTAAAAGVSGLDRLDGGGPAWLAPPAFLPALGWRSEAARALAAGRDAAALAAGQRAVVSDPMSAGAVSALATARLTSGGEAGALRAFRVAGQLGWRDRPTQVFWATLAGRIGAEDVAALRLDALLRQDATLLTRPELTGPLNASAAGRAALAQRLAMRPSWFAAYLKVLHELPRGELVSRAAVLEDAALAPPTVGCDDVQVLADALGLHGESATADRVRKRYCRQAPDSVGDPRFASARLDNVTGPGWQFPGTGGIDVSRGAGGGLVVATALPLRQIFAQRSVRLAPGEYAAVLRPERAAQRIEVGVVCADGSSPGAGGAGNRWSIGPDCPEQRIVLRIAPGSGPVRLDEFRLTPIRRAGSRP